MGTTFLKIACTDTGHSDLYVKAEDILIVDWLDATNTVIALSGGGLITLTTSTVSKSNNYVALGIYEALDKALQGAKSEGSSFVQDVVINTATVASAAFS